MQASDPCAASSLLCSGCVVSDTEVVRSRLGPGFYLLCLGNYTWGFSDVHNCPECWCVNGQSKESTHVALVFTIHGGQLPRLWKPKIVENGGLGTEGVGLT